jgi:Na+-driven multidrug efflux pump
MAVSAEELGTEDIKNLIKQAAPASIILFMSSIVDTIFVGQWIGSLAIAAVTVVLPITLYFIVRMAIGRRWICSLLVQNQKSKSHFANQIMMTFFLASLFVLLGIFFSADMLLFLVQRPHNKTGN